MPFDAAASQPEPCRKDPIDSLRDSFEALLKIQKDMSVKLAALEIRHAALQLRVDVLTAEALARLSAQGGSR